LSDLAVERDLPLHPAEHQLLDLRRLHSGPGAGDESGPDRDVRVLPLGKGLVTEDPGQHRSREQDPGDLPVLHGPAGQVAGLFQAHRCTWICSPSWSMAAPEVMT